ncbi:MAG: hypothetical protein WC877_05575 [Dehalococcoidales bacterium]|jgi:uncharacterized phiE125 gp8 family phage protein
MRLITETGPATEPISLAEAKIHLRLAATAAEAAAYTTEDTLLTRLIAVARIQTEQEIGRALITQTKEYYLDGWPRGDEIIIPYPPLQSATVTYRLEDDDDYDNTLSTVDTDIVSEPGRIILQPGETWPSGTLYSDKPIKIEFDCGYGDDADDVPETIRQAMLLKLTDLYEHRGQVVIGVAVNKINGAVDSLLASYKIWTEFD